MKYSLRSLMIVVTLVCVVLGGAIAARVEYLRRWAVYHERRMEEEEKASGPGAGRIFPWWHHSMMATRFRYAMQRPWTTVYEPTEDSP